MAGLLTRTRSPAAKDAAASYDAFISYAHTDIRLARAVQAGLHRFAKPWYRLRALRVFRDEASLAADPALGSALTRALDGSEWLLLLASPAAAASEWVDREVEHWCRHRPKERILILLADGVIAWDQRTGDFEWDRTDALPPSLRGVLVQEPRFVDLTWTRDRDDLSVGNPVFAAVIADIGAPLHGRPKDELLGEDVRQHRRVRWITGAAILALAVLLVLAVVAALVAMEQRETARNERDRATAQERIAVSRQLAAEATAARDDQLDLALLLAANAYAVEPTAQARGALLAVLARSGHLQGFLPGTTGTSALALDPTGSRLLVGTEMGSVSLWDLEARERVLDLEATLPGPVTAAAFTPEGRHAAVGSESGEVLVWDTTTGRATAELSVGRRVHAVAFDGNAALLATADDDGIVTVFEADTAVRRHRLEWVTAASTLAFQGDGTLAGADGQGRMAIWDLNADPRPVSELWAGAGQPLASAWSADAARFAGVTLGNTTPFVYDVPTGSFPFDLEGTATSIDDMALSTDGSTLAAAGEGVATLWELRRGATRTQLSGAPATFWRVGETGEVRRGLIVVGSDGRVLVVAGQQGIAVWNLDSHTLRRTLRVAGSTDLQNVPNVLRGAVSAAFSQDGGMLAWTVVTRSGLEVVVRSLDEDRLLVRVPGEKVLGFDPDGTTLATREFLEDRVTLVDVATGHRREVGTVPWELEPEPNSAGSPWSVRSGAVGASVAFDGTVTLWDVERDQPVGTVDVPGASDSALVFSPDGRRLAVASPGGALTLIDTDVTSWWSKACALAGRSLTREEQAAFLGSGRSGDACSTTERPDG